MQEIKISENHPSFAGHFPGQPILPGVLLLDRVMSLAEKQLQFEISKYSIKNAKFLSAVLPGDALKLELTLSNPHEFKFVVSVLNRQDAAETLACTGLLKILSD